MSQPPDSPQAPEPSEQPYLPPGPRQSGPEPHDGAPMQYPGYTQYPPQHPPQHPPQYPPQFAHQPPPRPGLFERLGVLALRRPEPRQGISLAGAGAVLVLAGILWWAGGYFVEGLGGGIDPDTGRSHLDDSRRFLGAGLAFVVTLAGYAMVIIRRRGPVATAGVIAGAIGVPLTIGFLSLDLSGVLSSGDVINTDAIALVSVIVWLISYLAIPGARGRAFYLGAAAYLLPSYLAIKANGNGITGIAATTIGSDSARTPTLAGTTAIGLIFGLGYYLVALWLDRSGRHGVAVAFVTAGFFATGLGIAASSETFHRIGTGVELIIIGLALSWYGGRSGRRFTTWAWTAGVVLGIGLVAFDLLSDSPAGAGITLIVIGLAVVAAAEFAVRALREPSDLPEVAPAG
jgi:hypothetical protein